MDRELGKRAAAEIRDVTDQMRIFLIGPKFDSRDIGWRTRDFIDRLEEVADALDAGGDEG